MKRIVIIGGMAGGAGTAARLRRLDESAHIVLFEKGGFISYASCGMPYWLGDEIPEFDRLIRNTPQSFERLLNVKVHVGHEVTSIDRQAHEVEVHDIAGQKTFRIAYDYLVIATGSAVVPLNATVDRELFVHRVKTLDDAVKLKESLTEAVRSVVVIGSGFIGLEVAENLRKSGREVTIIETCRRPFPVLDPAMTGRIVEAAISQGVALRLERKIVVAEKSAGGIRLTLDDGSTLQSDLLITTIGTRPSGVLAAEAGLTMGESGGITVDRSMRTSDPSIFAVGDVAETFDIATTALRPHPFAGPAAEQARVAADTITGRSAEYHGSTSAYVMRFFNLTIAGVGANGNSLQRAALPFRTVHCHQHDHASYFGKPEGIDFRCLFTPDTGRILGLQAVGAEGVEKRVDVVSALMRRGGTVHDLAQVEMCYAPPYNAQRDPLNNLGHAAQNILQGLVDAIAPEDFEAERRDAVVLDVRSSTEFSTGHITGAVNIPLDELRERLSEVNAAIPLVAVCATGKRSYYAVRLLMQNGYMVRQLDGGITSLRQATETVEELRARVNARAALTQLEKGVVATRTIDAVGLACPGPILKLSAEWSACGPADVVAVRVNDASFLGDLPSWCKRNDALILGVETGEARIQTAYIAHADYIVAKIVESVNPLGPPVAGTAPQPAAVSAARTFLIATDAPEKVVVALMAASTWAALGERVVLFFIFAGINNLRRCGPEVAPVRLGTSMFATGASAPECPAGGCRMLSTPEHIAGLQDLGVEFIACGMALEAMGLSQADLIDGVTIGGMMGYVAAADQSSYTMSVF